jgi:hypothetical protein
MEMETIEKKIAKLPENLKYKLEGYLDALLIEAKESKNGAPDPVAANYRGYGILKDKIWMSEDFNAPLQDFEEYM